MLIGNQEVMMNDLTTGEDGFDWDDSGNWEYENWCSDDFDI